MKRILLFLLLITATTLNASALRLDGGFTSNMVIQRDKEIRIFGTTLPKSTVSVCFARQKVKVTADASGRFMAYLNPVKANVVPQALTVQSGKEKVILNNVLVGDVWLCGGQSNMEFNMGPVWRSGSTNKVDAPKSGPNMQQEEIDRARKMGKASRPLIRAMVIEKELRCDTLPTHGWKEIDHETIIPVSAIAYFFALNMADSLNIPQGIIVSCWGGTRIEGWMNSEYSTNDPTVNASISSEGKMDGEPLGNRFGKMIKELAPMSISGFLWYQGCSNITRNCTENYQAKQVSLVKGWMDAFQDQTLGFYNVQLAPYEYSSRRNDIKPHTWCELADFRPQQILSLKEFPQSGMAATLDLCDNIRDIHPTYKWEVARRLALHALKKQFGREDLVCDGPVCSDIKIEKDKVVCTFDQDLSTNDGKAPRCFTILTSDGWVNTNTEIQDNKVIVRPMKLKGAIRKVHYAWDEAAITNLCNKHNLPAMPF